MPTQLEALYDLAEQLLAVDDPTDQTIDVLERTADRIDNLRASGAREPGPVRTRVAAQRPAQSQPQPRTSSSPRVTTGLDRTPLLSGEAALVAALNTAVEDAFLDSQPGRRVVARLHAEPGPELGSDADANAAVIASARQALTASGGACSPVPTYYPQRVLASSRRPVRDSLPGFKADRGGVRIFEPPDLHRNDASTAVAEWTYANDVTPTSPTTKPYKRITCGASTEIRLNAITEQLEFGNFSGEVGA
jgi:hypothetical protein